MAEVALPGRVRQNPQARAAPWPGGWRKLVPDDEPIVLLHVGFPKTATTSLQDHVFAGLPWVCNLGKPDMRRSLKKALRHIASDDLDRFERKHADCVRNAVRDARRSARSIVISHEGMTGSRWRTVGKTRVLRETGISRASSRDGGAPARQPRRRSSARPLHDPGAAGLAALDLCRSRPARGVVDRARGLAPERTRSA